MGYKFALVLSREINDEESAILKEAGCASAIFTTDSLPTNAEITVTKMDFDDTETPTLAEAIESALEAVKKVPDLTVPGLTVPAQPAERPAAGDSGTGESDAQEPGAVIEGVVVEEQPAAKKATARKPRKPSVKKVIVPAEAEPALVSSNGHEAPAPNGSDSAG